MSLSDPLVLKDSTGTDVSFGVQSTFSGKTPADPSGSNRVDAASSASEPRTLVIKQQVTGKGTSRVRRTLVQTQSTDIDSNGVLSQLTLNLSWVFPLNGSFSATDLSNAICLIADAVLTTGSLAVDTTKVNALLRGEA